MFKGESNYGHLAAESYDVFTAIVLIWEHTSYKTSLIILLLS